VPEGFCTLCGFDVDSFEGLSCCPQCGSKGVPCSYENQVLVNVNLHELRLLCIWAENWSGTFNGDAVSSKEVVYAIANRIRKQLPEEHFKKPLTMRDELQELRDAGYSFETNHQAADTPELGDTYKPDGSSEA